MKTIRKVPAFAGIETKLTTALSMMKRVLSIRIEAARHIAGNILDRIDDQSIRAILNIPVSGTNGCNDSGYEVLREEGTPITLLERIILAGIDQSQSPIDGRSLGALVTIQKNHAEKAGYKSGVQHFFRNAFEKLENITGGVIDIHPYSSTTKTTEFSFAFQCHFMKSFPWQKELIEV